MAGTTQEVRRGRRHTTLKHRATAASLVGALAVFGIIAAAGAPNNAAPPPAAPASAQVAAVGQPQTAPGRITPVRPVPRLRTRQS